MFYSLLNFLINVINELRRKAKSNCEINVNGEEYGYVIVGDRVWNIFKRLTPYPASDSFANYWFCRLSSKPYPKMRFEWDFWCSKLRRSIYLTLCTNSNVSGHRRIGAVQRLFNAQVSQSIFAENRPGIHVCCHEPTLARKSLFRSQTFHIRALKQHSKILMQVCDCCVNSNLVLPFKLDPHCAEFGVGASSRNDIVHDVNVNRIQHHNIRCCWCVIN